MIFSLKNISAQPLNFAAEELTERFVRGDTSRTTEGSGLGLSICQLIVKYMNGKLWVDSGYTRGARFCFTHPLKYNPALHGGTAQ